MCVLKVPQHVSDEDPVFNRTLRALKSHPNARWDYHEDSDGIWYVIIIFVILQNSYFLKTKDIFVTGLSFVSARVAPYEVCNIDIKC